MNQAVGDSDLAAGHRARAKAEEDGVDISGVVDSCKGGGGLPLVNEAASGLRLGIRRWCGWEHPNGGRRSF